MEKLKVLDLFSGIGGFSLGLERTGGFETVAFCEIEPFPQKVLRKHWPDVPIFEDVRTLRGEDVGPVDVICGGFPCQDISFAGKGAGIEGERSGLWSEIWRLIGELRPGYAILENVSALLSRGLDRVLGDLAQIGYNAEWHCIPASVVGAPHRRDRIWIVAYPSSERRSQMVLQNIARNVPIKNDWWASINAVALGGNGNWPDWEAEFRIQLVNDGVPNGSRICLHSGNAVVPQIPEMIGYAILEAA